MSRFLAVAVMLGVAFWEASPVEACTCVVPSTAQAVNMSDLVVMGRVVKTEIVSAGLIRVDVAVEQAFKGGDSRKSIAVFTRPRAASCYEYGFRAAKAQDLMLSDLPAGEYITGACLGTVDLATTEGRDWLRTTQQHFEQR